MMSLGEILFMYRARLRDRTAVVQELLAVVGIAVGVALLFASQIASTSLDSSVRQLSEQIVGGTQYQLDARGPEGFSEALLETVRSTPGVREALPLLEQQAAVIGPAGRASIDLIGADPRFAHAGGPLLRRFSARQLAHQRAIALPAPLAASIGAGALQPVKVQIGANVSESLVGAALQEADVGGLVHSHVALAPVSYAQELARMRGRVTRVFVGVQPRRRAEALSGLPQRIMNLAGAGLRQVDHHVWPRLCACFAPPGRLARRLPSSLGRKLPRSSVQAAPRPFGASVQAAPRPPARS